MMLSVSLLTSFIVSLNRYATDLEDRDPKVTVYYISEALISTLIGIFLGLLLTTMVSDTKICIVATGLGAYFGRYSLNIIAKILLFNLKNFNVPLDEGDLNREKQQDDDKRDEQRNQRRQGNNTSTGDRD